MLVLLLSALNWLALLVYFGLLFLLDLVSSEFACVAFARAAFLIALLLSVLLLSLRP